MTLTNYKITLLKIPVSDIDVSNQFYEEHLGFKVQYVAAEYGWAQMTAGDISLALYKPGMGGGNGQIGGSVDFHLSLPESDFQPLAKRLLERGLLSENMIHTGNDGSTFIDVLDPDKNIIKISKRK